MDKKNKKVITEDKKIRVTEITKDPVKTELNIPDPTIIKLNSFSDGLDFALSFYDDLKNKTYEEVRLFVTMYAFICQKIDSRMRKNIETNVLPYLVDKKKTDFMLDGTIREIERIANGY